MLMGNRAKMIWCFVKCNCKACAVTVDCGAANCANSVKSRPSTFVSIGICLDLMWLQFQFEFDGLRVTAVREKSNKNYHLN